MKSILQTLHQAAGFLILLAWLAGSSCAKPTPTPETQVILMESWIDLKISSFYKLASYSHAIILGRVVSKERIINEARWGDDRSQPADLFGIGQVYLVEVEHYLKGEGPAVIYLSQGQGRLLRKLAPGETPSPDEIAKAMSEAEGKDYIPLKLGSRYLFFLGLFDKKDYDVDGYRADQLYIPAGARVPWKFDASDLENIRYEEGEVDRSFPADLSLDEIIAQINATPTPPPYPPPPATPAGLPYPPPRPTYVEEPPPDTPTPTPDMEAALPETPPVAGYPAATLHRGDVWLVEHGQSPRAHTAFGDVAAIFGWNHDGTKLLFGRGPFEVEGFGYLTTDLWIIDFRTEETSQLTAGKLVGSASWSPVDDRVAYCHKDGLTVIDLLGEIQDHLDEVVCIFTWSPDGAAIALMDYTPEMISGDETYTVLGVWWLAEYRLQVYSDATDEVQADPIWSLDGKSILFLRIGYGSKESESGFYIVEPAEGRVTRLDNFPALAAVIALEKSRSPRADLIAFTVGSDIYIMDFQGRSEIVGQGHSPVWLPDGRMLLYRAEDGSYQTVVVEAELAETAAGGEQPAAWLYSQPAFFFAPGGE